MPHRQPGAARRAPLHRGGRAVPHPHLPPVDVHCSDADGPHALEADHGLRRRAVQRVHEVRRRVRRRAARLRDPHTTAHRADRVRRRVPLQGQARLQLGPAAGTTGGAPQGGRAAGRSLATQARWRTAQAAVGEHAAGLAVEGEAGGAGGESTAEQLAEQENPGA